jgi:DNA mismatch endonuclease, patch repair protein
VIPHGSRKHRPPSPQQNRQRLEGNRALNRTTRKVLATVAAPPASSAAVRSVMRGNRKKDTRPEVALRKALYASGLRFRKHYLVSTRMGRISTDIAFPRLRIAIFVDGCFWHGCAIHSRRPRVNSSYWWPKLARNEQRDAEQVHALLDGGWEVLRFWEHTPTDLAAKSIAEAVQGAL